MRMYRLHLGTLPVLAAQSMSCLHQSGDQSDDPVRRPTKCRAAWSQVTKFPISHASHASGSTNRWYLIEILITGISMLRHTAVLRAPRQLGSVQDRGLLHGLCLCLWLWEKCLLSFRVIKWWCGGRWSGKWLYGGGIPARIPR